MDVIINVIKKQGAKMDFSKKIISVRESLNLSQERFAKELGVSFATVNRWEKGHFEPSYLAQVRFEAYCKSKGIALGDYK